MPILIRCCSQHTIVPMVRRGPVVVLLLTLAALIWAHLAVAALTVCLNESPALAPELSQALPFTQTISQWLRRAFPPLGAQPASSPASSPDAQSLSAPSSPSSSPDASSLSAPSSPSSSPGAQSASSPSSPPDAQSPSSPSSPPGAPSLSSPSSPSSSPDASSLSSPSAQGAQSPDRK